MRYSIKAIFALALSTMMLASAVQAVPILIADNNVGIRILNLEVGSTLYNVDFEFDEWPEIYGGPTPVFDFDSLEEAQAAKKHLVKRGLPAQRIVLKSFGATLSVASNDTEEDRALNRRVTIRVLR